MWDDETKAGTGILVVIVAIFGAFVLWVGSKAVERVRYNDSPQGQLDMESRRWQEFEDHAERCRDVCTPYDAIMLAGGMYTCYCNVSQGRQE